MSQNTFHSLMRSRSLSSATPFFEQSARCLLCLVFSILLCLLSSGCITEETKGFSRRCCNNIPIVDRDGEISRDNDTISISVQTLKIYHYEPFWESSITFKKPRQTFTYSLTTPTSDAELSQWIIVPDESAIRVFEQRFDVLDKDAQYYKNRGWSRSPDTGPRHETPFILPVFSLLGQQSLPENFSYQQDTNQKDASRQKQEVLAYRVHVHAEDIHYLTGPFLTQGANSPLKLQIPYKIENGVFYLYSPKDSAKLFRPPNHGWEKNTAGYVWGAILPPVTLALDIVLLPFEAVGVVLFVMGMNW